MNSLEKKIQRDIEVAFGSLRDFLLLRNSNGHAEYVDEENGKVFHVPYGLGKGSPDLVGMLAPTGRWVCLEVKQPGEKPEPHQTACHVVWRRFGAFVSCVSSVEEAKAALARARSGAFE